MGNCLRRLKNPAQNPSKSKKYEVATGQQKQNLNLNDHTNENKQGQEKPLKSWEIRRKNINPENFKFKNQSGQTFLKAPGSINGQQFSIYNCQKCNIYIMDNTESIFIDDCVNCEIFIGPSSSSVYIRNTDKCKLIIACGQLRTRECTNLQILLYCQTYPVIESSSNIQFGCFQFFYPELKEQFQLAQLDVWNNNWSDIHDFTPQQNQNQSQNQNPIINQSQSSPGLIDLDDSSSPQKVVDLNNSNNNENNSNFSHKNYSYLKDNLDLMNFFESWNLLAGINPKFNLGNTENYRQYLVVPLTVGLSVRQAYEDLIIIVKSEYAQKQQFNCLVQKLNSSYDKVFIRRCNKLKLDQEKIFNLKCSKTQLNQTVLIVHISGTQIHTELEKWFTELLKCKLEDVLCFETNQSIENLSTLFFDQWIDYKQ